MPSTYPGEDGHPPDYLGDGDLDAPTQERISIYLFFYLGDGPLPANLGGDGHLFVFLSRGRWSPTYLSRREWAPVPIFLGRDHYQSTCLGKGCHLSTYFRRVYLSTYLPTWEEMATYLSRRRWPPTYLSRRRWPPTDLSRGDGARPI